MVRSDGRAAGQVRPIDIQYDAYGYADASVLYQQGDTKVFVGITLQTGVPPFLKGQRTGWLTAEYAMLPHATHQRTNRESSQVSKNARSVEISRLIGRCLRPCIDLDSIGEKTIYIDCDVLQADGGTRVACITAASLALKIAADRWVKAGIVEKNPFKTMIAGLSIGIINGNALCDITFAEDSLAETDFNFVMTNDNKILEIQGTCEKKPATWEMFEELRQMATAGIEEIFTATNAVQAPEKLLGKKNEPKTFGQQKANPFSLGNRLSR